jgi:cation-transporting ATPase 13A2
MKYILGLGIICVVGFLGTLKFMIEQGYSVENIIDRFLNLLTTAVPPALPAAMSAGTTFAVSRLKR